MKKQTIVVVLLAGVAMVIAPLLIVTISSDFPDVSATPVVVDLRDYADPPDDSDTIAGITRPELIEAIGLLADEAAMNPNTAAAAGILYGLSGELRTNHETEMASYLLPYFQQRRCETGGQCENALSFLIEIAEGLEIEE